MYRDQHLVEPERCRDHGDEVQRCLQENHVEERLAGERRAGEGQAHARQHHSRGQTRGIEIAETDPADHGRRRQAGEGGGDPVAAQQADDDAVTDAGAPGDREQEIDIGQRVVVPERCTAA